MPENRNQAGGFKVVDRRVFSADGTRREAPPEDQKAPEARPTAAPAAAAQSPGEVREDMEGGATGFDTLVSFLSTTAMFQLGLLSGPGGERISPDMVNARRTIELLEVVQQKTSGNLTADEARLLDGVLYELRMAYVEIEKRRIARNK